MTFETILVLSVLWVITIHAIAWYIYANTEDNLAIHQVIKGLFEGILGHKRLTALSKLILLLLLVFLSILFIPPLIIQTAWLLIVKGIIGLGEALLAILKGIGWICSKLFLKPKVEDTETKNKTKGDFA